MKSLFIKQEFKEDMKDENSLSDYLKKPSQRLNEYILHLQVGETKQFSCNDSTWSDSPFTELFAALQFFSNFNKSLSSRYGAHLYLFVFSGNTRSVPRNLG